MASCVQSAALASEQIIRQFISRFQVERAAFIAAIQGPIEQDRTLYASRLLERLIFLYFLQKHGLLDHDPLYLIHHLQRSHRLFGDDRFYQAFLLPLFARLYAGPADDLPSLPLRLFHKHTLEQLSDSIQIADKAFERLFAFFETFRWQLSPQDEDDLHPALLSTLFEQQLDRKQLGAYYTREDVTHYIASNTLIPCLLAAVRRQCPDAFAEDGEVWRVLQQQPERYLHAALLTTALLPAETKQEYLARQTRCEEMCARCSAGHLTREADLVTHNLNVLRFVQDIIAQTENPALLYALYSTIEQVRVLDPTCGSGAFLIAALRILEQLALPCLDRMQTLMYRLSLDDAYGVAFHSWLARAAHHQTRRHFVLRECIAHNLYGVDIMQEALEVCRHTLLLELLAEVKQPDEIIVPLELDTHIRAGNALLGHVEQENDHFHWYRAFPEVMERGGFDVILGNPPFVEYRRVRHEYRQHGQQWGNLYAAVLERSLALWRAGTSYLGLVVPLSLCSSARFTALRAALMEQSSDLWLANFEIFPSRLFEGAYQRLSILLARRAETQDEQHPALSVTGLQRWYAQERPHLLQTMRYTRAQRPLNPALFPKLASPLQEIVLHKVAAASGTTTISDILQPDRATHFVYYQEATNYWLKAACHIPYYKKNGSVTLPAHGRFLYFSDEIAASVVMALLNSSLFYVWFATYADGFHLSHALIKAFPFDPQLLHIPELPRLARLLEADIKRHARISTRNTHHGDQIEIEEYKLARSKACLDEIDTVLARHYHFTTQELAFIIHFDSKYRLGQEG